MEARSPLQEVKCETTIVMGFATLRAVGLVVKQCVTMTRVFVGCLVSASELMNQDVLWFGECDV